MVEAKNNTIKKLFALPLFPKNWKKIGIIKSMVSWPYTSYSEST